MSWVVNLVRRLAQHFKYGPGNNGEPPRVFTDPPSARKPTTTYARVNFLDELLREAERHLGTREEGGQNKGSEVERFQKTVDGKAQGESWCAAFVQFCLKEVVTKFGASTTVFPSEHCMTIWNRTSRIHRFKTPQPGYLVIWNHEGTMRGHIGIVRRIINAETIETIEGNTFSDNKAIEPWTEGVYCKTRPLRLSGKMRLVGYISPFNPVSVERPEITIS